MARKPNKNDITAHFGTWHDYLERATTPDCSMDNRSSRNNEEKHLIWAGGRMEAVVDLAKKGWPKGTATARELTQRMFAHISSAIERQDVRYDTHGHFIDVARFNDNEPECWGVFESVQAEGEGQKLIRILVNLCVSSSVSKETMVARGSVAAALVELLEFAGHRVELTVGVGIGSYEGALMDLRVRVKEFDQSLDLDRVIFACAHPGMFRRLMFSLAEVETGARGISHKYGIPDEGYGKVAELVTENGEIYFPGADSQYKEWEEPKRAEAWILEKLREQGVVVNEKKFAGAL